MKRKLRELKKEQRQGEPLGEIISRLEKEIPVTGRQRGKVVFYHHKNQYGFCRDAAGVDHYFNSKIIDGKVWEGCWLLFESENKRIKKARRINDEKVKR